MINWPNTLVRDIALRKCVLVLGAGISMNSQNAYGVRPKSWDGFLKEGVKKLQKPFAKSVQELIKSKDYLTACELLKDKLGRATFVDFLTSEYQTPRFQVAEIHKTIFKLDARIVITPNFDNIYDRYVQNETEGTVVIKTYNQEDIAEALRTNKRLILKIHGTIDAANQLIFSRNDYTEARTKFQHFYTILDALSITNTFLFLGCGTNDPDIRLILEDYNFRFKHSREHYITLSKNSNPKGVNEILEKTMNIKFLEYDGKDGHKELKESLDDLVSKVDAERAAIALSQEW